jgi:DNA-binding NarL/FixJ family response regulator
MSDEAARARLSELIQATDSLRLVSAHADAQSALFNIPELKPDFVLLDAQVPDMFWTELCQRLKAKVLDLRVLVLTESDGETSQLLCLSAGASGCVLKKPGFQNVPRTLLEIARGQSPHWPQPLLHLAATFQRMLTCADTSLPLTNREREVLSLWIAGTRRKEIAARLGISVAAAHTHLGNLRRKLGVHTREEAAAEIRAASSPSPT